VFQTKAGFKVGRLVQKEVVEVYNGQEHRFARHFFVHKSLYQEENDRWLYQLNKVQIDGSVGQPYNEHKWYKERDLKHIISE
jgi:hypothetical protein